MATHTFWLSSEQMTILVEVEDVTVREAPPIARRFVGQPLADLVAWMDAQGGFRGDRLDCADAATVRRFRGPHFFLSNFQPAAVDLYGATYSAVEHAYQAAKAARAEDRVPLQNPQLPAADAKRIGRGLALRSDWTDEVKIATMRHLVHQKFARHAELRQQLFATGQAELIEENRWRDRFWGVCDGEGQNWLGRILMETRAALEIRETPTTRRET